MKLFLSQYNFPIETPNETVTLDSIIEMLRELDIGVMTEDDVFPGEEANYALQTRIFKECDFAVFFIGGNTNPTPHKSLWSAVDYQRTFPETQRFIIPATIQGAPLPAMIAHIRDFKFTRNITKSQVQALIDTLIRSKR